MRDLKSDSPLIFAILLFMPAQGDEETCRQRYFVYCIYLIASRDYSLSLFLLLYQLATVVYRECIIVVQGSARFTGRTALIYY